MNLLKEFVHEESCSYLRDKEQTTHYKIIENCSKESCQNLIEHGYRRFGKMYFRPICPMCDECKSIKIDVQNFEFSKSARRILKKAKEFHFHVQRPSVSHEHLKLFEKYHLYMKDKKGWEYTPTNLENYYNSFVSGYNDFGYEVLYFYQEKLVAVDLIDILDDGVSSIYFYYDPDFASYSLGKLSLYKQIEYAKKSDKKWIYLGYYVKECNSLSYKAEYKPYLTLQGRPSEYEPFKWI